MSVSREAMLFLVLGEEAAEVAKETSKCIRFTPMHRHSDYDHSNYTRLLKEWNELQAMMELIRGHMLETYGISQNSVQEFEWREAKKEAFDHYNDISEQLGTLAEVA